MKSLFCFLTVALVALTSVANGAVTNVVLVHGAFTDGSGFVKTLLPRVLQRPIIHDFRTDLINNLTSFRRPKGGDM
jgi:hypothetical protein